MMLAWHTYAQHERREGVWEQVKDGVACFSNLWPACPASAIQAATKIWGVSPTEGGFVCAKGKRWNSSEHYYQVQKFGHINKEYAEDLYKKATDGLDAKRRSSQANFADWYKANGKGTKKRAKDVLRERSKNIALGTRRTIMATALGYKFSTDQNPTLAAALVKTHPAVLHESGGRGKGSLWDNGKGGGDLLGKLLMERRDALLAAAEPIAPPATLSIPVVAS